MRLSILLSRLPRLGATGRAVAVVAGGTILAQSISAAVTPVLTRLYGPETLGVLATVLAYAGLVGPVAGLCLPIAIVLAAKDVEVADLARAARVSAFIVGLLSAVLAPFLLVDVRDAGVPWQLVCLVILLLITTSVAVQVAQQRLIALQDFSLLGTLLVGQAGLFAGAQVVAGLVRPEPSLLAAVSGIYFVLFLAAAHLHPRFRGLPRLVPSSASVCLTIRRWKDFPRYRAPQVLLSALGIHLPTLLLAALVDLRWAGFFLITYRILALPVMFVGKAISDVIYPQVVALSRTGSAAWPLLRRWTGIAAILSLPLVVILLSAGPRLFAWALGDQWAEAGLLAQAMAAWMLGALVSRPVVGAVPVLGLQRHYLVSDLIAVTIRSAVLALMLSRHFDVAHAILVWALMSGLGNAWITTVGLVRSRHGVPMIDARSSGA